MHRRRRPEMPFHHRNRRRRRLHRPHLLPRTFEALLPSDSSSSPLCQGIVCHRRSIASSSSMSPGERPQWPLRSTRRTPAAAAAAVNAKDDGAEPRVSRNGVVGSAAAARVVPLRGDGAVLPGGAADDALVVEAVAEEDLARGLHGGAADDDAALRLEEAVLLPQVRRLAPF